MLLKFRNSIFLKMVLLVLGGTSLVFAFSLGYNYVYSRNVILEDAEQYAVALSLSVARRIEQEFRAVAKIPENLSRFIEAANPDKETLVKILQETVLGNPEIFGSTVAFEPYVFDKSERLYAPYYYKSPEGLKFEQLGNDKYDYLTQDWYHIPKELKKPMWAEPYFDEGGGGILMTTYSCPLFQKNGSGEKKLNAIITADISLDWLSELVRSIKIEQHGFCFIISDTGTFVAHPKTELITRESIFSLAEEYNDPELRKIGRSMIRGESGFVDMGSTLIGKDAFLAYARIASPGWSLGAIFPKSELFAQIEDLHNRTMLISAAGIALLLGVSLIFAASFARPLRRMAQATEKIGKGEMDVDLSDIKTTDEIGQLAQAFDQMVHVLRDRDFIRDMFGRYLTREVVNRLLESKDGLKLGGESREISIMMSDLRGFTALTTNMHPEQVIAFLNRYLGKMVEILLDYRGTIDEIVGDGILAFFGAPEPMEDHPARAVACALQMQKAMEEINELNEADGLPTLEMGVAVNTGHVVVGNIGSERRAKYGAVGSQVNFTGRIESFTVGGQVLISKATYEKLADKLDVRKVLKVEMKGIPGKVELYDIRGIKEPFNVQIPDRDHTPIALKNKIPLKVYRIDQKMIKGAEIEGWITHLSRTSARLITHVPLNAWEDLRLVIMDDPEAPKGKEVFAKTVSVEKEDKANIAFVRFTSVSPEAYNLFRRILNRNE